MPVDGFRIENDAEKYWPLIVDLIMDDTGWACDHVKTDKTQADRIKYYFSVDNSNDQPVGCVILSRTQIVCGPRAGRWLSTVGFFFVRTTYRGLGLGKWLFDELEKDADEDKFLTATPLMWNYYRDRRGFDKITDYKSQYLYTYNCAALFLDQFPLGSPDATVAVEIRRWTDVEWPRIGEYVSKITHCDLNDFFRRNFSDPTYVTRVAVDEDGKLVGICSVRLLLREEVYIGPFYADNDNIARLLVRDCMSDFLAEFRPRLHSKSKVALESASTNDKAVALFRDLVAGIPGNDGNYEVAACRVMFTREILDVPTDSIYSIATGAKTVA